MSKPLSTEINIDPNSLSLPEARALRRQLAKVANERMRQLEKTSSKITGEKFTFGAYERTNVWLKEHGRNRFSETLGDKGANPLTLNKARQEITVLQKFLGSKTSTIRGFKTIEQKRIETFELKGIHSASTKEFYDFLNSESFKYLSRNAFDSEKVVEEWEKAKERGASSEDIQKAFDDFRSFETKLGYKDLVNQLEAIPIKGSAANENSTIKKSKNRRNG